MVRQWTPRRTPQKRKKQFILSFHSWVSSWKTETECMYVTEKLECQDHAVIWYGRLNRRKILQYRTEMHTGIYISENIEHYINGNWFLNFTHLLLNIFLKFSLVKKWRLCASLEAELLFHWKRELAESVFIR